MKTRNWILIVLIIVLSCKSNKNSSHEFLGLLNLHSRLTFHVDSIEYTPNAYSGYMLMAADTNNIYFSDYKFGIFSATNIREENIHRIYEVGKGPYELQGKPHKFAISPSGKVVFVSDFAFSFGDIHGGQVETKPMDWKVEASYKEMQNKPKAHMSGIYEIDWSGGENQIAVTDNLIYLPIESSHPLFNPYKHKNYYKTARVFGIFNYEGELVDMIGRRSIEYLKYKYVGNFDDAFFTLDKNNLLVSFPIDSLIYVMDSMGEIKGVFGKGYPHLNQNYPQHKSYDAEDFSLDEWEEYGTYQTIKCSPYNSVVVRKVYPGKGSKPVLQIFQNYTYLEDIPVSKDFVLVHVDNNRIIGYKALDEHIMLYTYTYNLSKN